MGDFFRYGIRGAVIAGVIIAAVGVYALFSSIQVPAGTTHLIVQGVGMGKAYLNHWAPELVWVLTVVISLFTVRWALFLVRQGIRATKWVLEIFA